MSLDQEIALEVKYTAGQWESISTLVGFFESPGLALWQRILVGLAFVLGLMGLGAGVAKKARDSRRFKGGKGGR